MKWYEHGILFEGTPAEFHVMHPELPGSAPVSPVTVFPEPVSSNGKTPAKNARMRERGRNLHVVAELSGGGERHFKSAAAAYRWYASACPVRNHRSYIQFYDALKKAPIRFADAVLRIA